MAIYTKTGDKGTTSLFGGKRLSKANSQIEAYGSADELTSFIGLVAVKVTEKDTKKLLAAIQKDLYVVMGFLAGMKDLKTDLKTGIKEFEQKIDDITSKLPVLNRFILPGGTELSGWFHILRTVCRRAERDVVKFFGEKSLTEHEQDVLQYLNRLSDLFFILARWYGKRREISVKI